jgi:hydroxymethylpyrimidine pyrophosphatase-like HAD family hydrolase
MENNPKLIVSDFDFSMLAKQKDGLLTAEEASAINETTKQTLTNFQSEGGIVAFCSGNDFHTIIKACEEAGFAPDIISSKCGTVLHNLVAGKWVEDEKYSREMKDAFDVDTIIKETIIFAAERGHSAIKHLPEKNGLGKASVWTALNYEDDAFPALLQQHLHDKGLVNTVLETTWSEIAEGDQVKAFETLGFDTKMVKNVDNLAGSKGYALKFLIDKLSPSETIVMGDSGNDKTLFKPVEGLDEAHQPKGILPNNASAELIDYVMADSAIKSRTAFHSGTCGNALSSFLTASNSR